MTQTFHHLSFAKDTILFTQVSRDFSQKLIRKTKTMRIFALQRYSEFNLMWLTTQDVVLCCSELLKHKKHSLKYILQKIRTVLDDYCASMIWIIFHNNLDKSWVTILELLL